MEHPLAAMQKLDPELIDHIKQTEELFFADGALPCKVKLLIALAFDAAHGAVGGVRALASQAKAAGATDQEIAEAMRVAYHLTGVGSVYTASQGLKDIG